LQDNQLLAKLSVASDLVALEAKYHLKCLPHLYNRVRTMNRKISALTENDKDHIGCLAFTQLVSYVDEYHLDDSVTPIFKLYDLAKLYKVRLGQFGGVGTVHSTRLKEQLLSHFPDMRAHEEGRDVLLMFDYDIGPVVLKASQTDCQQNALCSSHAAQIVRQEIFQSKLLSNETFPVDCQEQSVPKTLLALESMILEGPSISVQSSNQQVPGANQISQLIVYNSVNHARPLKSKPTDARKHVRHSQNQETPLHYIVVFISMPRLINLGC
jgi:hypothetical protein